MSDEAARLLTAHRWSRRRVAALAIGAVIVAAGLQLFDANPAVSQSSTITALRVGDAPGLDPGAGAWDDAPSVTLPLSAQQTTYPFGGGSIPTVDVRAVHDDAMLYVRVDWADSTKDNSTATATEFADGVAVEFPAAAGSSVPSVCMGQADGGVNIWQWRADSQRGVAATPKRDHPNASVDEYPSKDDLAYPARKVGNRYASRRGGFVQDLVAQGFGTLEPAPHSLVTGRGAYSGRFESGRWRVVFARPFSSPDETQPSFGRSTNTDVAVAVWNGSDGDRNGQKSVSTFAKLEISTKTAAAGPWAGWAVVIVVFIGVVALVGWFVMRRFDRRPT